MNTKLITALRITANALENRTFDYNWMERHQCNCGSLVCALTGNTPHELAKRIPKLGRRNYTWTNLVGMYCPITGMTQDTLFSELRSYGLTHHDIVDLEYLRNPKVVQRVLSRRPWHNRKIRHNNRLHAAEYMRAWADILTEEGRDDVVSQDKEREAEACRKREQVSR